MWKRQGREVQIKLNYFWLIIQLLILSGNFQQSLLLSSLWWRSILGTRSCANPAPCCYNSLPEVPSDLQEWVWLWNVRTQIQSQVNEGSARRIRGITTASLHPAVCAHGEGLGPQGRAETQRRFCSFHSGCPLSGWVFSLLLWRPISWDTSQNQCSSSANGCYVHQACDRAGICFPCTSGAFSPAPTLDGLSCCRSGEAFA